MNNQYYIDIIRPKLTEKRFHHSMCLAGMAGNLAEKYGPDPEKAYVAGILHDIMKDTPKDEQLKIIENSDILLDNVEKSQFKLLHAIAGYAYIRDVLKIDDEEILTAVRYHTTGRASMTLMEKILYVADYISEDRDFEGVEKLRKLASQSLDSVMLECTKFTINDLLGLECPVHPDSIDAYNDCVIRN